MKQKRFFLPENEIPTQWYNIQADMPTKPMPMLNPQTGQPVTPEDLYKLFAREVSDRVVFMDSGYIVEEASPEELFGWNYRTEDLFAGILRI